MEAEELTKTILSLRERIEANKLCAEEALNDGDFLQMHRFTIVCQRLRLELDDCLQKLQEK